MAKIETVLFDFDGTLMNTTNVIMQSWQEVYRTVRGKEEDEDVILKTFGSILGEALSEKFPEETEEKLVKIYRDYHHDHFLELIDLYPGVRDMLEQVRRQDVTTALVTSRLKRTTMMAVEEFDLGKYFDTIVTADDCTKHKPDPEPLNIAMGNIGARPESSLMVGDTLYDRICARNAGTYCAMVDWAPSIDVHSLSGEHEPDHILMTAGELLEII